MSISFGATSAPRALSLLVPLLVLPASIHAQVLTGSVVEAGTGTAIAGAEVLVRDSLAELAGMGLTGEDGRFRIALPSAGTFTLTTSRLGYTTVADRTVEIPVDREVEVVIRMAADAVVLDPIEVVAVRRPLIERGKLAGFYQRREWGEKLGRGQYITYEQIEDEQPISVADMLSSVQGLQRIPHPNVPGKFFYRLNRGAKGTMRMNPMRGSNRKGEYNEREIRAMLNDCMVAWFLDGAPFRFDITRNSIDDFIRPSSLAAVEVYRRASEVPQQFAGMNRTCGVVALWTRRGNEGGGPGG